jgi:hypothetical protein
MCLLVVGRLLDSIVKRSFLVPNSSQHGPRHRQGARHRPGKRLSGAESRRHYQFLSAKMRRQVYMRPPARMPTEMATSSPDNQAPIIPPTATLASNQKNQIASLKPAFGVRGGGTIVAFVVATQHGRSSVSRGGRAPRGFVVGPLLDSSTKKPCAVPAKHSPPALPARCCCGD